MESPNQKGRLDSSLLKDAKEGASATVALSLFQVGRVRGKMKLKTRLRDRLRISKLSKKKILNCIVSEVFPTEICPKRRILVLSSILGKFLVTDHSETENSCWK